LTSIFIPASLTTIGAALDRSTLWDCTSLTSITVDAGNPNYSSVDGVMYNKLQTTLIQYPGGKTDASFTIPSSVTAIEGSAFRSNALLTSVTIPNSVTSTGTFVFNKCTGLTSAAIGNGLAILGTGTFQGCTGLTSVTIGNSVTTLGRDAFQGCTGLTSVTIPASVTKLGTSATNCNVFNECKNLSFVSFLGNAPTLANINAFFGTTPDFQICYTAGATGFSNPWNGYPASTCEPPATTTTTMPATTTTTVPPTLISLSSFDAKAIWRFVILTWETESEIDNAEFNIYRAESEDGEYVKINSSPIPAKGSATESASYRYIDLTTKRGTTYYYKLEDVDLSGIATMHGPVSATPGWLSGLRKK
jgi:hypothetical protein